ncbi:MAG: outer membrane beta-barrel protein [Verrucomicrobiota bacterium]
MKKNSCLKTLNKSVWVGGALLSSAVMALADDTSDLKARVAQLEAIAAKEGILPSGTTPPKFVSAMSDITVSGFVQASYFYNTRHPADGKSDGYLWNTSDNSFSLNKFKLTLASKPVATDKWDAGFRASLMFGEDAADLNSGSTTTVLTPPTSFPGTTTTAAVAGFDGLREAFVEINVPIGTGLNIKAGELISLLNWESGDGGAANPNFSQGNQWWFTGNGPSAGVQATYNFTDKVGLTLRVDNGLFQGPVDNNEGKAFSGSLAFKPTKDLWFNIIGWYDDQPGGTDVSGFSTIGGLQVTKALGTGWELDYFNFSSPGNASDLWSGGLWVWYDFTSKLGVALRADYIGSPDPTFGLGPAVRPGAGVTTFATGENHIGSVTFTVNLKPTASLKIQPELRYDFTNGRLDGKRDRVIVGCGATYMF